MQHFNKKLLLIKEDMSEQDDVQTGLEQLGQDYFIDVVDSGTSALQKLSKGVYDALITRSFMQDMTGSNLARLAKKDCSDLEVFLIAPEDAHFLHQETFSRDIDHLIYEPVSIAQLQHLVETACRHSDQSNMPVAVESENCLPLDHVEAKNIESIFSDSDNGVEESLVDHEASWNCPNHIQESALGSIEESSEAVITMLKKMKHSTNSHCVMLLSSSGHIIDYAGGSQRMDITNISTLIAANFMATYELAKLVGNDSLFKSTYHAGINYDIYSHALNEDFLLVSIFDTNTKVGLVRFGIKENSEELLKHISNNKFSIDFSDNQLQFGIENELDKLFMG